MALVVQMYQKIFILCKVSLFGIYFLLSINVVFAKNFVFQINGTSGEELSPQELALKCLEEKGWNSKVFNIGNVDYQTKVYNADKAVRIHGKDPQNLSDNLSKAINQAIKDYKITKNDQLLIKINTHGISNCSRDSGLQTLNVEGFDMSAPYKDQNNCDHKLVGDFDIDTKELIPVIKGIEKNGVNIAVDMISCFGGAAIKDFAEEGICAKGSSSADQTGGTPEAARDSGYYCLNIDKDKIINETIFSEIKSSDYKYPGSVSALYDEFITGKNLIDSYAANNLRTKFINFDDFESFSRQNNPFTYQPIESNGPYWIFNNLGILGNGALEPSNILFTCISAGIDLLETYKKIQDLNPFYKNCNFDKTITQFKDQNSNALINYQDYYNSVKKEMFQHLNFYYQYISEEKLKEIIIKNKKFILNTTKIASNEYDHLHPFAIMDKIQKNLFHQIFSEENFKSIELQDNNKQIFEAFINAGFDVHKMITSGVEHEKHRVEALKAAGKLEAYFIKHIVPLERKLYATIMSDQIV